MITFEYPEDRKYFIKLLNHGDEADFDKKYYDLFDFREPAIKRSEFNKIQKQVLPQLINKYNNQCQYQFENICSNKQIWQVDHIIPLATNILNKKLRNMKGESGKKVSKQSFGSNDMKNLVLACKNCNGFKKHRFYLPINFNLL